MKTCFLPWLLATLCAPGPMRGQDAKPASSPPPVTLSYPATDGIIMFSIPGNTATAAARFYAYGGEAITLSVTVQAPLGTHLRIFADVYQTAGAVATPWQRHVPVSEEIVFANRTSVQWVACKLPELRAVQRKTAVSVTLRSEPQMTAYPGGINIRGFVYPREEPGAWQKRFAALLARAGVRRVAVFGTWKNPANFLRGQKVAFADLGDGWPTDPDPGTLYLGSGVPQASGGRSPVVPKAFGETRGARLVLFEPWDTETLPPGVYQTPGAGGGGVWKVTLPDLFVGAGPDQPHELEILATLFEQILPARQPTPGENPEPTSDP